MKWLFLVLALLVGCAESTPRNRDGFNEYELSLSREELIDKLEDLRKESNIDAGIEADRQGSNVSAYNFRPDYEEMTTEEIRKMLRDCRN
jgi:hypothetical protein